MLYHGNNLNLNQYLSEKEAIYNKSCLCVPWEESEDYIWAIEEYIGCCGIEPEVIFYLNSHDMSVGDFEEELSIEEISEIFIDGRNLNEDELAHIIKWLYEYMTANDMSLSEIYSMCLKETEKVFNYIF